MRALPLVTASQQEGSKYGSLCLSKGKVFLPKIVHIYYDSDSIYQEKNMLYFIFEKVKFQWYYNFIELEMLSYPE